MPRLNARRTSSYVMDANAQKEQGEISMARRVLMSPLARILIATFLFIALQLPVSFVNAALPDVWQGPLLNQFLSLLVTFAVVVFLSNVVERRSVATTGLTKHDIVRGTSYGFLLGAGMMGIIIGVLALAGWYVVSDVTLEGSAPALLSGLILFFLVGIGEEVLFRGILFRVMEEGLGSWLALAATALLFGFIHMVNDNAALLGGIGAALIGVILAAAYMLTRNLWLAIGIHWSWNLFQGTVFGVPVSGRDSGGSLLESTINGPQLWTGGAFGVEASLVAILLTSLVSASMLIIVTKGGHVVTPKWMQRGSRKNTSVPGTISLLFAVLLTCLSLVGCGALEVPQSVNYPQPTGPYKVGRTAVRLVDTARAEPYSPEPADTRELMVQLSYPAEPPADTRPGPWVDAPLSEAFTQLGVSREHVSQIQNHSYPDAPVASERAAYPVLLLSHGDVMLPAMYTVFAEELASQGYIVVALSHTYNAPATVFPDGRTAFAVPEASAMHTTLPPTAPLWDTSQALWKQGGRTLEIWVGDLAFVLNQLSTLNKNHPLLAGKFDLERVGVLGHSFGGAAATELLARNSHVLAAANLDGSLFAMHEEGLERPLINLVARDNPEVAPTDELLSDLGVTEAQFAVIQARVNARRRAFKASKEAYNVTIQGAEHMNFSDAGLLTSVLPQPAEAFGPIGVTDALNITTDYLVAFFDTYIKGASDSLLQGPSPYQDVLVERSHN